MTGYAPDTCPYRALQDPLVRDVLRVLGRREGGLDEALVGGSWEKAPRRLVVACAVYDGALRATIAEGMKPKDPKEV